MAVGYSVIASHVGLLILRTAPVLPGHFFSIVHQASAERKFLPYVFSYSRNTPLPSCAVVTPSGNRDGGCCPSCHNVSATAASQMNSSLQILQAVDTRLPPGKTGRPPRP